MSDPVYPSFRVLAVDDEVAWLRSLRIALQRAGIDNVLSCQDAREVPALLASEPVGLVLLDLNMPNVSGEELLSRLTSEHPDVPVIVISGMNQVDTAVRCVKLGALDYYVKTDEESRLVGGISRAVRMVELTRENREIGQRMLSGALEHPEAFAGIVRAFFGNPHACRLMVSRDGPVDETPSWGRACGLFRTGR